MKYKIMMIRAKISFMGLLKTESVCELIANQIKKTFKLVKLTCKEHAKNELDDDII